MAEWRGSGCLEGQLILADFTREQFTWCCGATRWVDCMMSRQPFGTLDEAIETGDRCWQELGPADWLEAFEHHPRIGERVTGAEASEQAGAQSANDSVKSQLLEVNREYEQRFGHIYIVCATGKTADELLAIARSRLTSDPAKELRVAADELRKIMHLRMEKLFEHD
jgi:OHCU decarboxylase